MGLQDKFVAYWDYTSDRLAKNKYVVGYDPFNEPLPANMLQDMTLFTPGVADRKLLAPMYSRVYEKYI